MVEPMRYYGVFPAGTHVLILVRCGDVPQLKSPSSSPIPKQVPAFPSGGGIAVVKTQKSGGISTYQAIRLIRGLNFT